MNSLNKISNDQLELRLKDLVQRERKLLHIILEHIKEVELRKIHLAKAYPSMYEYLTKELGYSGSAAMRRLEASRLLRDVPLIAEKIKNGSINLSQIGELSKLVKEKERVQGDRIKPALKNELVEMISGKTLTETQRELSLALNIEIKEQEKSRTQKDESVRLEITLTKKQFELLQRCKDLAAHAVSQRNMDFSWASVLEILAEKYVKGFGPKPPRVVKHNTSFSADDIRSLPNSSTNEMTLDLADANETTTASVTKCVTELAPVEAPKHLVSRSCRSKNLVPRRNANPSDSPKGISPKSRRLILARDHVCQYKSSAGKQCGSKFRLEVDHKQSRWANGSNGLENLQILCAAHNKYKYRKEKGMELSAVE